MYVPKLIFLPAYVFAFHFYYDGASTGMYQLSAGWWNAVGKGQWLILPHYCYTFQEAATWLPKGFVDIPRFEIPLDVHQLEQLTPIQYLNKYCVITSRVKKLLYHRQYTKYREPKIDGIDSLEVCTYYSVYDVWVVNSVMVWLLVWWFYTAA